MKYLGVVILIGLLDEAMAQSPPGIHEINAAKTALTGDFIALARALSVIGGFFGLLGGLRVFNNWQLGKRNIDAEIIGWFSSCIFFNLIALFISTSYGISLI